MSVPSFGLKALAWLRQAAAERRATLALGRMNIHDLHDIGIDRGAIDYAVRKGRISL